MIILDTDHLTVLKYPESSQHARLEDRLAASNDPNVATTIVNAEEQMRGWLAEINRLRVVHQQILAYERLLKLLDFLNEIPVIPFDASSADEFERLRRMKVRIGSMDLKVACIALVHNALLLSANLSDFQKVPGLRVENWLKE
ncbi:MAG TPA: type II toxin-antitoxin system VapC family toxin [Gemmataceae bacterium]|nr:type II toxin-antitoxin system VapC family toxin [Gemmataceae bacterium]